MPGTSGVADRMVLALALPTLLAAWLEVSNPAPAIRPPNPVRTPFAMRTPIAMRTPVPVRTPVVYPVVHPAAYERSLTALSSERTRLAAEYRTATTGAEKSAVVVRARAALGSALTGEIVPAWYGTMWSFNGTSEIPGQGTIACGYFVSTVLRDAGFPVDRVSLARMGSGDIVRSLVPSGEIERFDDAAPSEVIRGLENGIHLVGLEKHVGFLVIDGPRAELCHSSNRWPRNVRCENARQARSMVSDIHIVGPLLGDARVVGWLLGASN